MSIYECSINLKYLFNFYESYKFIFFNKIATLENCTILEKISPNTFLFLQTHKRVWPATQRDALFWSHMRQITDGLDKGAVDCWIVCNKSTDYLKKEVTVI